jgi:thioester reductase-like protein
MTVEQMSALAELDPAIAVRPHLVGSGDAPSAVLLTGATGFVGAFLLGELLRSRDDDVLCLVRAEDEDHAMRRLLDNLAAYGVEVGPARSRIRPVVGDLAAPRLGLTDQAFADLHDSIGSVFHNGATVKWTYPYSRLAPSNVHGTQEVLRLATLGAPRPVHFTSTVGVFSSAEDDRDVVHEDDDLASSGPLVVGYAQSKWVAERMVRTAHDRGLPVTIHRINTGGHSRTGAFNRLDHLSMLIKGCIEAGIAPLDARMPLQPAPVDFVARGIVELASQPEFTGRTSHLVNPSRMSWADLFDHVERLGHPVRRLPFDDWRERVITRRSGTVALLGLAPFLAESADHVRLPFSASAATQQALGRAGISCPPLDARLIGTYLDAFARNGFIRPPESTSADPTSSAVPSSSPTLCERAS